PISCGTPADRRLYGHPHRFGRQRWRRPCEHGHTIAYQRGTDRTRYRAIKRLYRGGHRSEGQCGRRTCSGSVSSHVEMVISAGFEPTPPGLGILCSILLSYETSRSRRSSAGRLIQEGWTARSISSTPECVIGP